MKKIVFATNNAHKLDEIRALFAGKAEIISLAELGCTEEIPETGKTLKENALIKARYVKKHYDVDCFADDTGLEIDALNGAPGVYSARYAGEERSATKNMERVLNELNEQNNRAARFRTVIALIEGDHEMLFEGIVEGSIAIEPDGKSGFGYDPIFIPTGFKETFGQLDVSTKNSISHRARAVAKLIEYYQ